MVEQIVLHGELTSFEITFYPIVEDKQVIGVSCFGRDITKLMQTQHDLKRTLQRLEETTRFTQLALNRLPIGVAVNEIESGKMTFVNDQFIHIYGWSLGEVSDVESFFERVYPEPAYRKEIRERIMADMANEDPERMQWDGIKITTSEGAERYINAKNIPVYEQNFMISTVIDVTLEYKHISTSENQNERLKKIAWHQSHMVRSKLTNVISLISLIREDANKGLQSLTLLERLDQETKEFDMAVRKVAELGSHNNNGNNQ